ncbi:MAG: FAD-dependent oxidoreductase [Armatimonadota bacterium]
MIDIKTHSPFRISDINELKETASQLGIEIPIDEDISVLSSPFTIMGKKIPNLMVVQPMEGNDASNDGTPEPLVYRRYKRFGAGGAGMIWFEACAVHKEGRANPRQLMLTKDNLKEFSNLVDETRKSARESMGSDHNPFLVLQLTHSGRYSRPYDLPKPIIAFHDPLLDKDKGLDDNYPLITDSELDDLIENFVVAAKLAFEAGFDAVDVKSCHRYLLNELLAGHTREGKYGGSYENRTRFIKDTISAIYRECGNDKIITSRLGIFDSHPYPYGWGMDIDNPMESNLEEPIRLVQELKEMGLPIINITMGNPYFQPHINRPYDRPIVGMTKPDEHPLYGVARLTGLTAKLQKAVPDMPFIGSGFSWLRNLWPYVASASIKNSDMMMVGLGRQSLAYPFFAKEIIETGKLDRSHTCITCSSCTQIMRDGGKSGCVPFDSEIYGPIYREGRLNSIETIKQLAERCRDCFNPTCVEGCPAHVNIPAFLRAAAEGDIHRAYNVLREKNALPELCGRVCPSDVQCEAKCVEKIFSDNPVSIKEIQKFVSKTARQKGWAQEVPDVKPTGKKVAIIGAGPAGLACASKLLACGHNVDIYDLKSDLGGTAASAIPSKRLQLSDFAAEAKAVFENYGERFNFIGGKGLTKETPLDYYINKYDAVFLGMGLGGYTSLTDRKPAGVEEAVSFLTRAKSEGAVVPNKVAVLGGGNTAMDAATTAKALGARDVYIVYRRSLSEMPAWPQDIKEAMDMGVHFLLLTAPLGYVEDECGNLAGVQIARTLLGEPDASGRRRPEIIPDTDSILEVEMAIEALGQGIPKDFSDYVQGVELTPNHLVKVDMLGRTSREKVFAGGDIVNGGTTAVQAISEGMIAAEAIDEAIRG